MSEGLVYDHNDGRRGGIVLRKETAAEHGDSKCVDKAAVEASARRRTGSVPWVVTFVVEQSRRS